MNQPTVHNPTNFEPRDYEVEDYLDNRRPEYYGQPVPVWEQEIAEWKADMERTFGADWIRKIHQCSHCGNGRVRWITAVRHLPTNDVVVFGSDCTDRLGFANQHAFKLAQLQARAEARKVRFTVYNKRAAFLTAHPEIADALVRINEPMHANNAFVKDVLHRLDQYGELSDKQVAAVVSSLARDRQYAERKRQEQAEPKGAAPSGRAVVTGTVLSIREQESQYGITFKMLVKLDNNAKVWVTAPSGVEKGDQITVRATWEVSKDDPSFAFGKRPHLVDRVAAAEQHVSMP